MAVVTGLTKERMEEMEAATVISGHVEDDNLILVTRDNTEIDAGNVRGPVGPSGGAYIQCTNATQPSLEPEEAGKAIYETDTKLWRIWTGTYYRAQESIVCTSTTRPTTLLSTDAGVKIFETDTGMDYFWTGTSFFPAGSYVARFTNAAARSAAWPSPNVGALSYLNDAPGVLWIFENGVWNSAGGPPGTYFPYIGTTAPVCHVLMYGQTISNAQTLYPILWANTPSTWKSGSGLIVPDMRGRVPVGLDNMGGVDAGRLSVANNLGDTGGEEKHILSLAEMPSHTHTQNSHNHNQNEHNHNQYSHNHDQLEHRHTVYGHSDMGSGENPYGLATLAAAYDYSNKLTLPTIATNVAATAVNIGTTAANVAATATNNNTGGGNSHNNMPPYILMNWALKVL